MNVALNNPGYKMAGSDVFLFTDILVPLDNFVSRGTAHFLTCKAPDYQQSLWNMISSVSCFTLEREVISSILF